MHLVSQLGDPAGAEGAETSKGQQWPKAPATTPGGQAGRPGTVTTLSG